MSKYNHAEQASKKHCARGRESSPFRILRTKPGKGNAINTESMSCSDKVSLWNLLGIQGALISNLACDIFLSEYLIGEECDLTDLHESICRFSGRSFSVQRGPFISGTGRSFSSVVVTCGFKQVCVSGRKQGSKEVNEKSSLIISRHNMFKYINKILKSIKRKEFSSVSVAKAAATQYQLRKEKFMSDEGKGWIRSNRY